jgi:hypothetical protein
MRRVAATPKAACGVLPPLLMRTSDSLDLGLAPSPASSSGWLSGAGLQTCSVRHGSAAAQLDHSATPAHFAQMTRGGFLRIMCSHTAQVYSSQHVLHWYQEALRWGTPAWRTVQLEHLNRCGQIQSHASVRIQGHCPTSPPYTRLRRAARATAHLPVEDGCTTVVSSQRNM